MHRMNRAARGAQPAACSAFAIPAWRTAHNMKVRIISTQSDTAHRVLSDVVVHLEPPVGDEAREFFAPIDRVAERFCQVQFARKFGHGRFAPIEEPSRAAVRSRAGVPPARRQGRTAPCPRSRKLRRSDPAPPWQPAISSPPTRRKTSGGSAPSRQLPRSDLAWSGPDCTTPQSQRYVLQNISLDMLSRKICCRRAAQAWVMGS